MEVSVHELEIMRHTISDQNRNWFGTSKESKDCNAFERLASKGLATKRSAPSFWGDDFVFSLTEKGCELVKENEPAPAPEKLTKGKARYRRYLEWNDCFDSFIEFCRWDADPEHEWNQT